MDVDKITTVDTKKNEIDIKRNDLTPLNLLELAITNNADIDKLEKLMELKERWDKEQARKAFIAAMADFQFKCPVIRRTKDGARTKSGELAYKYAPLDTIIDSIRDILYECGLSFMIKSKYEDGYVESTCIVKHTGGHSEESTVRLPLVTQTGILSPPQIISATKTYATRNAICDAFGIVTGDEDTDAIMPFMTDEFNSLTSKWEYKDAYINQIANSIKSGVAFNQFVQSLPTHTQTDKFIELVEKMPEDKRKDAWLLFQKCTKDTSEQLINKLTEKLKENKNDRQ